MPRRPDGKDPATANQNYSYDLRKASQIVEAMDFLRQEAVRTSIPEIVTMIDASFQLLVTTYYSILRYEMTKLSGTDRVQ